MKITIIYDTQTGNTAKMADYIIQGIISVDGMEARAFNINEINKDYAKESSAIIIGTPTYNGCLTARMKAWLETGLGELEPAGKLGGTYATAIYVHGGGDLAMQCVFTHMLVAGMMVYSSGIAKGEPVIHLGPVATASNLDDYKDLFVTYGRRMAEQAAALTL